MIRHPHLITALLCCALLVPLAAFAIDTDGDGIDDPVDNCTLVANPDQRDTDGDGIGNMCDADINNDGIVNSADYLKLKSKLGTADPNTDLNGDGIVNGADYLKLKAQLGQPPGPAAVIVTVTPRNAGVTTHQTQQFTATVKGHMNRNVSWNVDGIPGGSAAVGTISINGLYTPPASPGAHVVNATSQANASNTTNASVNIAVTDLTGVVTFHNDNGRTGQNRQEYALTPAAVSTAIFGKRFACAVDGQLYAQPLYVPDLAISGGTHNVIFAATEHDSVYAFDADASPCVQYWKKSFLGTGITTIPANDTNEPGDLIPEIGITSTPVIDIASGTIYVMARTKEAGNYFQRLHALALATSAEKFGGPVLIQATLPGTGTGSISGSITFNPLYQNQRSALLLLNGVIYIAWASHGDQNSYHGWVMGYNATTLARVSAYIATASGDEGGIWMSGNGPVADAGGSIYVITGNGAFDANGTIPPAAPFNDLGDSFIRLTPGLVVADYFTPADQLDLQLVDWDLGSSGAVALPDGLGPAGRPNLLVGGGKEGSVYVLNRQNLGKFTAGGPDQILQTIPVPGGCVTCGLFGSPAVWQTGAATAIMYLGAVDDTLRSYALTSGQFPSNPNTVSTEIYHFPGVTPAVSSNGSTNGIVWALDTSHNGTPNSGLPLGPAVLRAYDANDLQHRLYSSDVNVGDTCGNAVKFTVPTVANGKVYVGGNSQVTVYGLLP